jgi:mono/diheme cytochrome c family protein
MNRCIYLATIVIISLAIVACSDDDTSGPPAKTAYDLSSVANGGMLYDTFWSTETGFDQSDANLAKFKASADFFRCKQCHGWDQLGTSGSYINRGPKASRPNIASVNLFHVAKTKSAQELFDVMKKTDGRRDVSYDLSQYNPASNSTEGDKMPDYTQILSDAQIWDLVKFLKEGAFDVTQLYDATYTGSYPTGTVRFSNVGRDGDAANGATYFNHKCAMCHGYDGTDLTMEGMTAGKFVRSKPNEVQHKIKYGQLGSIMPGDSNLTITQVKDLYKAMTDTTAFPD